MMRSIYNERGSAWAWIFTLFLLIVVGAGAYLFLIKFGIFEAPEFLAQVPGMEFFIPEEEEPEGDGVVEMTNEETLRNLNLVLRGQKDALESRVAALEQELAEQERLVQEREDQIARLQDALNLARDQNINNVALIYEAMEPEEASVILSNMGAERASLILGAMRESKAAEVLELMDESLATEITQILAGFEGERAEMASSTGSTEAPPASTGPRAISPTGE